MAMAAWSGAALPAARRLLARGSLVHHAVTALPRAVTASTTVVAQPTAATAAAAVSCTPTQHVTAAATSLKQPWHLAQRWCSTETGSDKDDEAEGDSNSAEEKKPAPVAGSALDEGEDGDAFNTQSLKPREVVSRLDRHIIGQTDAKRAVAVALRNRWRRMQLSKELQREVVPKNILMGVGKTEVARRLANLLNAPFVKVEATKFTEVGFHGRDVDMIIRDLVEASIHLTRKQKKRQMRAQVLEAVEERLLEKLTGAGAPADTKESFRNMLREGQLENRQIELRVATPSTPVAAFGGPGGNMEAMGFGIEALQNLVGKQRKERKMLTIEEARPILEEEELEKALTGFDVTKEAIKLAEEGGIVFIDEIDKITSSSGSYRKADASDEGVQRDLLPLVEGSLISTKHGNVATDHMLFIASGAFHASKPSDLLPELQGRFPIRVELKALTEDDLRAILTEPEANLVLQQQALMATEGVKVTFEDEAVMEMAALAAEMNASVENIGARRLHTVMERLMEELSFEASDMEAGSEVVITKELVRERLGELLKKQDLKRFIL